MGKNTTSSRIHVLFFHPTRLSERIDYCLACILVVPHSCTFAHHCDCPEHLVYEWDFVFNPSEPTASSVFKRYQPPDVNSRPIFLNVFHIYHCYSNQVTCSGHHIGNGACDINNNSQHTLQQDNQVSSHIDPQMPPPPLWTSLALRDHVATHPIVDSFLPEVQTPPFHSRPFPIGNMDFIYENQHSNKQQTTANQTLRLSQTRQRDDHSFRLLNGLFGQETRDSHDLGNGISTEAQFFNQLLIKLINTLDIEPALQESDNIHDGIIYRQEGFIEPDEILRCNDSQGILSSVSFDRSEFDQGEHNNMIIHGYHPDFNREFDDQCDETSGLYKDCIDDEIMDTSPQLASLSTDRDMEGTGSPHLQRPANPVARILERGGSEHMVPIITEANPRNGNNNHANNE